MATAAQQAHWKLSNIRRRVQRARRFPDNTDGCSRHLHGMADALSGPRKKYEMFDSDPVHCAVSIYAVLESLWKLRTEHAELQEAHRELQARVKK